MKLLHVGNIKSVCKDTIVMKSLILLYQIDKSQFSVMLKNELEDYDGDYYGVRF